MLGVTPKYRAPRPGVKRAIVLLVAGGACAGLAACSSSSTSSASTPVASTPAASTGASTPAAVGTGSASMGTAAGAIPAADCTIIKQVDSSAITTLTPLSTESGAKQAAAIKAYESTLKADLAKLTSAGGKKALTTWITTVGKATTESTASATTDIAKGLTALGTACP